MAWWIWLIGGLALLLLEMATPGGFYFLFFGAAALIVGMLASAGMEQDWLQLLVWSVLSVGSLLVFRGPLLRRMAQRSGKPVDAIAGETATLTEDLPPRGLGKAELRGSSWTAQNASDQPLARGQRVRVERVQGLTLIVGPE
jgi:membrane protein implicated in regulation of membrane protease activity